MMSDQLASLTSKLSAANAQLATVNAYLAAHPIDPYDALKRGFLRPFQDTADSVAPTIPNGDWDEWTATADPAANYKSILTAIAAAENANHHLRIKGIQGSGLVPLPGNTNSIDGTGLMIWKHKAGLALHFDYARIVFPVAHALGNSICLLGELGYDVFNLELDGNSPIGSIATPNAYRHSGGGGTCGVAMGIDKAHGKIANKIRLINPIIRNSIAGGFWNNASTGCRLYDWTTINTNADPNMKVQGCSDFKSYRGKVYNPGDDVCSNIGDGATPNIDCHDYDVESWGQYWGRAVGMMGCTDSSAENFLVHQAFNHGPYMYVDGPNYLGIVNSWVRHFKIESIVGPNSMGIVTGGRSATQTMSKSGFENIVLPAGKRVLVYNKKAGFTKDLDTTSFASMGVVSPVGIPTLSN